MYSANVQHSLYPYSPPSTYPTSQHRAPSFSALFDSRPKQSSSFYNRGLPYPSAGLRTPPNDDSMNATYANPVLSNSYENHVALARQPHGMPQMGRTTRSAAEQPMSQPQYGRVQPPSQQQQHQPPQQQQSLPQFSQQLYPHASQSQPQHPTTQPFLQQQQQQPRSQSISHAVTQLSVTSQPSQHVPQSQPASSTAQPAKKPKAAATQDVAAMRWEGTISKKESKMVTHSLELPPCISPNGGRLDDFAAFMTCFFWFETMDTIRSAEHIKERRSAELLPRLSQYTEPCPAYKKWVQGILSTTQVTQNVILLALLFVYRLKKTNPKVNGNPGSEYRLLTVALMLGNKFLDDNTYTNKTWAEVSGISVKEIHVMEVEFLSNMRYGLLTSKDQWQDWLAKLACFHQYTETARLDEIRRQAIPAALNISPSHSRFSSPLPSPTSILPSSMPGSSTSLNAFSSASIAPVPIAQNWPASYHPTPSISPHAAKPSQGMARKRSLESMDIVEPAPKRMPPRQSQMAQAHQVRHNAPTSDAMRLPVPQLSVDTNQNLLPQQLPQQQQQSFVPPQSSTFNPQQTVSLPPLGQGMRAMATVFAPSAPVTAWAPQASIMAPSGPQTPTGITTSHFGTPSKRHSPGSVIGFASSPLVDPYAALTPISNSPSIYLQQRNSPYKPIRRVHTLLNPPPSIPLSEYHLGSTQMHYQPIGRRNDLRTGIVPEFLASGQMQMRYLTHTPGHSQQPTPQQQHPHTHHY